MKNTKTSQATKQANIFLDVIVILLTIAVMFCTFNWVAIFTGSWIASTIFNVFIYGFMSLIVFENNETNKRK